MSLHFTLLYLEHEMGVNVASEDTERAEESYGAVTQANRGIMLYSSMFAPCGTFSVVYGSWNENENQTWHFGPDWPTMFNNTHPFCFVYQLCNSLNTLANTMQ